MLFYIFSKCIHLILCCALFGNLCSTMSTGTKRKKLDETASNCEKLPLNVLKILHGPAFDARYMSIEEPLENDDIPLESMDKVNLKRKAEFRPSFYETDDLMLEMSKEPAWNIQWDSFKNPSTQIGDTRRKRSILSESIDSKQLDEQQMELLNRQKRQSAFHEPWRCEKEMIWVNLGPDYHPSHLRTVVCTKPKCYYGQYECKPRQFVVKVLKRHRGQCEDASGLRKYGFSGKTVEIWRWVEKSVNFCCDCVAPKNQQRYY